MSLERNISSFVACVAASLATVQAQDNADIPAEPAAPHFRADVKVDGLSGWRTIGRADWKFENGVIQAHANSPVGGWLVMDSASFANVAIYTKFRCPTDCRAGIMLRATPLPDGGLKGVYVALSERDLGAYAIAIDKDGHEISRRRLASGDTGGGLPNLVANTPKEIAALIQTRPVDYPKLRSTLKYVGDLKDLGAVNGSYLPGKWNSLNIELFQDMLVPSLNGGAPLSNISTSQIGRYLPESIVPADVGSYGKIALFAAGSAAAQFDGLQYEDLTKRTRSVESVSKNFSMQRLDGLFASWSPAVGDFNHDGNPDVAAGPWIYYGPDFTRVGEYYTPVLYNPSSEYPQVSTLALSADFTGDGWPDILQFSGNAGYITGWLYVNPKGESRHWDRYEVLPLLAGEDTELADIDGDGKKEVIHGGPDYGLGYSKPDPQNPTGRWLTVPIAPKGPWGDFLAHGLGVGDINGDGRPDIVSPYGWWEHPIAGETGYWKYHAFAFTNYGSSQSGPGGSQIGIFDVNGDGLADVIAPQQGHGFGLAWFEQKRDAKGNITFIKHWIMNNWVDKNAGGVTFTELHAAAYADMDGDGIPDIVTGKRQFSHLSGWVDPDPWGEPVLYVYKTVRDAHAPGGARFEPELVHNFSGVGSHISVDDMNGDGIPDIETSGPYGTFVFLNKTPQTRK